MKAIRQWWYEIKWLYCIKHKKDLEYMLGGYKCKTCVLDRYHKAQERENVRTEKRNNAIAKLIQKKER